MTINTMTGINVKIAPTSARLAPLLTALAKPAKILTNSTLQLARVAAHLARLTTARRATLAIVHRVSTNRLAHQRA